MRQILVALIVSMLWSTFDANPVSAQVVTAAVVLEGQRSIVNDVIEQAGEEGRGLLIEAARNAEAMIDRIEQLLGENVQRPLQALDETLRNEVQGVLLVVESLKTTADSLPRCLGNEAEILVANLKSGLATALDSVPLVDGQPIAYFVARPSARAPFSLVRQAGETGPFLATVRGANLWRPEELCDIAPIRATALSIADATQIELRVFSYDPEKITLQIEDTLVDGEWILNLQVQKPRRSWYGGESCDLPQREEVSVGFLIERVPLATATAVLTPICKDYAPCTQHFADSCTSKSSRRTKNCPSTYMFEQPGCEYLGHDFAVTYARKGARAHDLRNGNTVIVHGTAEKIRPGSSRSSKVTWEGVIHGRRYVGTLAQPPIEIAAGSEIIPEGAREFQWAPAYSCELDSVTLRGNITLSDGTSFPLPEHQGHPNSILSTTGRGFKMTLNTQTGFGTTERIGRGCL